MSFDLELTNFSGRTATFSTGTSGTTGNGGGASGTNNSVYDNNTNNQIFSDSRNGTTITVNYGGTATQGVHELYVGANFYTNSNTGGNNIFNQIFYTDAGGGFHTSSISSGSYDPTNNTFQVLVASGANNSGFSTGNLVVSNGNGFTTTATYFSQTTSGSNQVVTYQLGGAPTTSGTYHVYVSGYNVGTRGIDSTPTLNVTAAAPAPTPAPCYVTGTRVRVLSGRTVRDVPVECLRVGELAITASGKPRPIRWIGTRSYPGLTAPKHDRPVRIRAGALADGVPARDLLVSPDHALMMDGLFVAAGHLVNGSSITRGEPVADLTYWHVELESHDLLLAENTPAESFLAAPGVRAGFDGTHHPDAHETLAAYAVRVEHGPELAALRKRLIARAGLSVEPVGHGSMRAWFDRCDGRRLAGWGQDLAHPNGRVCLDVVVDGAVVAMTIAEQYRADIAAAGVGDGCHGFDFDLDEPLTPGLDHTVELRRSADGMRVCAMAVDAVGAWTPLLAA